MILSIETSTKVCSVALHNTEGQLLAEASLFTDRAHSERLTVLIEELFSHTKTQAPDLEAVAVSEGPGSYTGLRIGVSTAKGLAMALGIPLINVGTLQALALQAAQAVSSFTSEVFLRPMLDARRMEVYTARFNAQADPETEVTPFVLDEQSFSEETAQKPTFFFGNGALKFQELIPNRENAFFIANMNPSARTVGELALRKYAARDFADLAYFEPLYLKAFKAIKAKKKL